MQQPVKGQLKYAPDGVISQKYGENSGTGRLADFYKSLGLKGHSGIDFYGKKGTPIYAAHDGKVTFARKTYKDSGGKGIMLSGKNILTKYFHLDTVLVKLGEEIKAGQQMATMGNTGSKYYYMSVHLHFGYYKTDNQGSILNTDNGYRGAIDSLPLLLASNDMKKIIGDKSNNRQYLQGDDGVLHWIFGQPKQDSVILIELHNAGIINKTDVEWKANLDGFTIGSPWGALK